MSLIRGHVEPANRPQQGSFTLATATPGSRVRVLQVSGRKRLIQRLAALGVVPGVELTVVKPSEPAIVSLGGARIALGHAATEYVEIEIANS